MHIKPSGNYIRKNDDDDDGDDDPLYNQSSANITV
jgi:hypothetical protein